MTAFRNADERYWSKYTGLQAAKHQFLSYYLDGWFPILTSGPSKRLLYIDCHAGRGRYQTGHIGSPILAINRLLGHKLKSRILEGSEIRYIFFEINPENFDELQKEISQLGSLPGGVVVEPYCEDYEKALRQIIHSLTIRQSQLAPTFAFLDPYGFGLSMDLLNALLSFPRCELLINFMYHYIDMAIHQPVQESNMNSLFGGSEWNVLKDVRDPKRRAKMTIGQFSKKLNAQFVTHLYMIGKNNVLKYALLHATNHPKGRDLCKEAMWSIAPIGNFQAFERENPDQLVMIETEPDLKPLDKKLWQQFSGRSIDTKDIYNWLLEETYLKKHLHTILRFYRKTNGLEFSGYSGDFAFSKNPRIVFPSAELGKRYE